MKAEGKMGSEGPKIKQRSRKNKDKVQTLNFPNNLDCNVVLVGLMGAGKSCIGRRLAQRLSLPFVDADAEIEAAAVSVVEASPAGDPSGNQEGYAFLSRLRPDNAVYRERAEAHQGLESGMLQPSLSATPQTAQPGTDQAWQLTFDIQTVLTNLGYNPGTADGIYGPNTKAAIEAFQRKSNLPVDGQPSQALLDQLERAQ